MRWVALGVALAAALFGPADAGASSEGPRRSVADVRHQPLVRLAQAERPGIVAPLRIDTDQETIDFSGRVEATGTVTLSVNGKPLPVGADGSFRVRRAVPVGLSLLRVVVEGSDDNRTQLDVFVQRAAAVGEAVDLGAHYALVIGNGAYRQFAELESAVADAIAVAALLTTRYGFEVETLIDAARFDIVSTLFGLRVALSEKDSLLIYYAGRSQVDADSNECYWLPLDADEGDPASWLSSTEITGELKEMLARHVLIVADSCYSGGVAGDAGVVARSAAERASWLARLSRRRSRTVLTAGGLEPVPDAGGSGLSVFALALLEALGTGAEAFDGRSLFDAVKRTVSAQVDRTPEYADVGGAGHEGGEFLFVPVAVNLSVTVER